MFSTGLLSGPQKYVMSIKTCYHKYLMDNRFHAQCDNNRSTNVNRHFKVIERYFTMRISEHDASGSNLKDFSQHTDEAFLRKLHLYLRLMKGSVVPCRCTTWSAGINWCHRSRCNPVSSWMQLRHISGCCYLFNVLPSVSGQRSLTVAHR